jgi:hypothetical protein
VPFVRPVHAAVVPVTTHEPAAGDDATTYAVIELPPSLAGDVHEMAAVVSPAVATPRSMRSYQLGSSQQP